MTISTNNRELAGLPALTIEPLATSDASVATIAQPVKRRSVSAVALAIAVVIGTILLSMGPAQAKIIDGGGTVGGYLQNQPITCRHQIKGQFQSVVMSVPPPAVYAKNYRAGANNDAAWIRYSVELVDYRTGRVLQSTPWSAWSWATDVTAAPFSGATVLRGQVGSNQIYTINYRVEWWGSSSRLGWIVDRSTNFFYYSYSGVGPIGMSACWPYR